MKDLFSELVQQMLALATILELENRRDDALNVLQPLSKFGRFWWVPSSNRWEFGFMYAEHIIYNPNGASSTGGPYHGSVGDMRELLDWVET